MEVRVYLMRIKIVSVSENTKNSLSIIIFNY